MAMDERGLGKRLQMARQKAGLTQQQLCQKAGLSFSTLTKIERGAIKAPSIFTIRAIAGVIGTSLDELVGDSPARSGRHLSKTRSGAGFIYFDVNGCLVSSDQAAFIKLAADTGTTPDVVESLYWRYNDEICRGQTGVQEFNSELAKITGVKTVDWQSYYLEVVEKVRPMHEIIESASRHYKVGLLTNIMPGFVDALRRSGQIPDIHYDAIIDSSEVGALKPEARIYQVAAERAGCTPEEIMLIDDSRPNLVAAAKLGWKAIWFDDAQPDKSAAAVRQALEPAN
jgi:8-oxo-dGTP diphosphatase/putative hydrolase of the HAD superfamily